MADDRLHTDDGSYTRFSERYQQSYHSTHGALTEANHVYLDATGVTDRLRNQQPTQILEIGFGLGLNALLCADLAQRCQTQLSFHSFEHDLMSSSAFEELEYQQLVRHPELAQQLKQALTRLAPVKIEDQAYEQAAPIKLGDYTHLHIHQYDVSKINLKAVCGGDFQAIFLDAFSPDVNAECWSPLLINQLAQLLANDGHLSTYCSKGDVRRALLSAGLSVTKRPGPPGKREILVASSLIASA